MPKKITAYACSFGCGQRVVTSKKSMEDHETRCFYNPATKSCATCRHFYLDCDIPECDKGKDPLTTKCPDWDEQNI